MYQSILNWKDIIVEISSIKNWKVTKYTTEELKLLDLIKILFWWLYILNNWFKIEILVYDLT